MHACPSADKAEGIVHHESTWQQSRLNKDLKAVTYAEHRQAILCHPFYLLHYGTMGSNYSRAKSVAKGKTSGDYHSIITADAILSMPNKVGLNAYYIVENIVNVAVAVAARENSYPNSCCHITLQQKLADARINIFILASFILYNYIDR